MRLSYDKQLNVAYLRLREKSSEVETLRLSDDLLIDIGPDGRVFGIEFLNAAEQLADEDDGHILFTDPTTGEEKRLKVA